ncbi:unnamed protein product, partial [Discosporangium mesarthrocarpum]
WPRREESAKEARESEEGAQSEAGVKAMSRGRGDTALMRRLAPLYLCYALDSVGMGVALPALPFYIMSLRASALQLALVVSSNYVAQTFGERG